MNLAMGQQQPAKNKINHIKDSPICFPGKKTPQSPGPPFKLSMIDDIRKGGKKS